MNTNESFIFNKALRLEVVRSSLTESVVRFFIRFFTVPRNMIKNPDKSVSIIHINLSPLQVNVISWCELRCVGLTYGMYL